MPPIVTPLLIAESAAPAAVANATRYQFTQWQSFTEWWQTPLLVLVCLAVVAYVIYMYFRDSVELKPGTGWFLAAMRLAAFAGLLLAYLDLQKWSEQTEIQNSRMLVLVDTSMSMGLPTAEVAPSAADTRTSQVVSEFTAGKLLGDLRKTHDVTVWRFDQDLGRVASLPKLSDTTDQAETNAATDAARLARIVWLRYVVYAAAGLLAVALLGFLVRRLFGGRRGGLVLGTCATLSALVSFGALAYMSLDNPDTDLVELIDPRIEQPKSTVPTAASQQSQISNPKSQIEAAPVDWASALKPRGIETRLGECLRQLVNDERAGPISGILVLTDGGQNAGLDPQAAIDAAREAKIPVYLVGLGFEHRPASVRIADFAVPPRAYPGDSFKVSADIEAQGLLGRQVQVELLSRPAGKANAAQNWNSEGNQPLTLAGDGKKERVTFELPGIKDAGRRTLQLKITLPASAHATQQSPKDLVREADVEIVDRKNRVLLVAGGPTREYQFLRNQLRRDRDTIVDVLLQTAVPGVSQDANQILDHFPATMQELAEYDTIIAFDPDWRNLDRDDPAANAAAIDLLEKWVAEEAGGLIVIAGPVYTDDWAQDPKMAKIRNLYPVEFSRLLTQIRDAKYGSEKPGSIDFTREGLEAEFLWLDTSAAASQHVWAGFKGVYGYYRVKGKKAGATVYAHFADPDAAAAESDMPIYMAGQLYGSGRVFYLGSGEMWRLRAMDETYFDQIYTKLIRHVSQGRLLRGSRRGSLAVDRETYLLGSTVDVEARLTDVQHQPLKLPKVVADVSPQEGPPQLVPLLADPSHPGMFHGQFVVLQPGPYKIELPIPESQEEPLVRQIIAKVPDLEKDNPQRNDPLMKEIAKRTGGEFYAGIPAALGIDADGRNTLQPLVGQLKDQKRETPKAGSPDKAWEKLWMAWLLGGICGFLCLEWLVRRLSRLA